MMAFGLLAGIGVALIFGNPWLTQTQKLTKWLLAISIVALGAGMDLLVVARAGLDGIGYTVLGIAFCLALGALLTRALGVERNTGILISVGTAICGGSAIAAIIPILKPKTHEVSVALAIVFLLNALALFVFPVVGHALAKRDSSFGLWCALAIHDTSSVVGASIAYGGHAVDIATPVKLTRALWVVPLTFAIAQWHQRTQGEAASGKPKRPWFIAGFLLAAAVVTFVPALQPAGHLVAAMAKYALALTLFLIGSGLTRSALKAVGLRPFALGVLLWIVMASVSLAALQLSGASSGERSANR